MIISFTSTLVLVIGAGIIAWAAPGAFRVALWALVMVAPHGLVITYRFVRDVVRGLAQELRNQQQKEQGK